MNKEYKNVSQTEILGHSPGTTFTADLPESQEKSLLEGGGLKVIGEVAPVEPEPVEPVTPEDKPADENIPPIAPAPNGKDSRGGK